MNIATLALSRVVFWSIQCRKMSWPWNLFPSIYANTLWRRTTKFDVL